MSTIERLDESGFVHSDRVLGLEVARMSYRFEVVQGGTLYENELVVGTPSAIAPLFNRTVRPLLFSEAKGRAWLKHNVEEVGAFEHFLPARSDAEQSRA
ncbi:MAG TPA: hypothetical protein VI072_04745 [Polyangiaceae bacterium]